MSLPLVGTGERYEVTTPLDIVTAIKLTDYCLHLQERYYPATSLMWDTATLDSGTVVIQVFDPGIGLLVRTLQPHDGVWEVIDHTTEVETTLCDAPTLAGLLRLDRNALPKMHEEVRELLEAFAASYPREVVR